MSSGMLKKFRDCPLSYRLSVTGKAEDKDSAAYRFGRAAHKMILEGPEAFSRDFAIGGPVNPKTGKCYGTDTKAFAEWLIENNFSADRVVTNEESEILSGMQQMVAQHPQAAVILDYGWPELVVRGDLHGVPCQARIDWLTHDTSGINLIIDLKTVDDITWFQSDAYRYEYPHQFAFYRDLCHAITGEPFDVAVIVVEKKAPFRVGVWNIPPEVLDIHSGKNKDSLAYFKDCQVADNWPTGYENLRQFPLPRIGA